MALWGGRFSSETRNEVTQYSESISFDQRLYHFDIAGSKAHVTMLAEQGIIPAETAKAIREELDRIERRIDAGEFRYDIAMEDIHMHIESALIEALGAEGARVHSARSRNDQVALDIRLYLRSEVDSLIAELRHFQRALVAQADAHPRTVMPGFTHLQHAQPVLFAHHLLAYVEMLDRDAERLAGCRERINVMPLGSGAIAGSTLPINRERVCEELGFSRVTRNSMDAVADRDFAIELVSDLAIFAMHTSRLSEDLILWCSQEFDFIELDDAFCTGSSLMPQKKNPDVCELTRGKTARVYGALTALLTMCKGLPLTYNRDLQEDKEGFLDADRTVDASLMLMAGMLEELTFRTDRMRAACARGFLNATELADYLVGKGLPFREAHHVTGHAVALAEKQGKGLEDLSLAELQQLDARIADDVYAVLDYAAAVRRRETPAGTGPRSVARQIEQLRTWLRGRA